MEHAGSLIDLLRKHGAKIGHVQLGNVPGRYGSGEGELGLDYLIRKFDDAGWSFWIGLEFDPSKGC